MITAIIILFSIPALGVVFANWISKEIPCSPDATKGTK
jgi:hypothetical protein